jgi:hypothetical protein
VTLQTRGSGAFQYDYEETGLVGVTAKPVERATNYIKDTTVCIRDETFFIKDATDYIRNAASFIRNEAKLIWVAARDIWRGAVLIRKMTVFIKKITGLIREATVLIKKTTVLIRDVTALTQTVTALTKEMPAKRAAARQKACFRRGDWRDEPCPIPARRVVISPESMAQSPLISVPFALTEQGRRRFRLAVSGPTLFKVGKVCWRPTHARYCSGRQKFNALEIAVGSDSLWKLPKSVGPFPSQP